MMPASFCGVFYLEMHLTRHLKISLFLSIAVQVDLTQILKCQHFFGTDLSLHMTLMSPTPQDTMVKLWHSPDFALRAKGKRNGFLSKAGKLCPKDGAASVPRTQGYCGAQVSSC